MEDLTLGLLAIAAGALFCFRGQLAFRIVIPLWAAFVGFTLGAGVVAAATDESFLGTGLAWLVGLGVAAAFALLAYLVYEVAVVIAMGSIGFALGTSLMVALDVSWTWVVVLAGSALGLLLAVAAITANLPMLVLVVLSAMGGASAITAGIMLLTGAVDTADFDDERASVTASDHPGWYVLYLILALAGVMAQIRDADRSASMQDSWAARRAA